MTSPIRGHTFTRTAKAIAVASKSGVAGAIAYARSQGWHDSEAVIESIEKTVTAVGTDDFSLPSPAELDFADILRPQTIIGKLVGTRRVPARVRLIAATSGSGAYWSGERSPRPLSRSMVEGSTLEPLSVTSIVVLTQELVRSSAPSAESILSRDLIAAAVAAMDSAFVDPGNAGIAGVKPASIVTGATALHSAGSSLANIDSDLGLMVQALSDAGSDLTFATWILNPRTALYLARQRGTGGALAHPFVNARGGTLLGIPVVTSASVPIESGSPGFGNATITLLDAAQILVVDDGGSSVQSSSEGAIEMESATTPGGAELVSLFQTQSVALKISRFANWARCRDGVAQVLDGVTF